MDKYGERDKRLMAAFLMSETRRENDGSVVTMDPAVLEEMLRWLPPTVCWNAATEGRGIVVSPDQRSARAERWSGASTVRSLVPIDDFTINVSSDGTTQIEECVYVGFTTRTNIARYDAEGVNTVIRGDGIVCEPGERTDYCMMYYGNGTMRCVADRAHGTIYFYVDGVKDGFLWTDVPPWPLYAFVIFFSPGVIVEFV